MEENPEGSWASIGASVPIQGKGQKSPNEIYFGKVWHYIQYTPWILH